MPQGMDKMNRVLFDPVFEKSSSDGGWEGVLEAAQKEVDAALQLGSHVALQVFMCVRESRCVSAAGAFSAVVL